MSDTTLLELPPGLLNHCNRLKSKEAKGNFLTSLQTAFPIGRKQADKAPERERPFKQRRGRSKTCGAEFEAMALSQHRASGFMCAPYMHARIGRLVKEWEQLHGAIEAQVLDCRESCPGRQFVRSQQEVDFERTEGRTAHDIPLCVRHAENAIRTPEGGPTGDLELVRCTCIRQIGLVVASLRCAF